MKHLFVFLVFLFQLFQPPAMWGQKQAASGAQGLSPSAKPVTSSFDVANIDQSVDPCVDFYQYACGNWIKNNPLPPDHSYWGSFPQIGAYNESILGEILEKASKDDPKRSPLMKKIGDFYATCMDQQAADRKGYDPIKPDLALISSIKDKGEMFEVMARLEGHGAGSPFAFSSGSDLHGSDESIAFLDQGGLSLPDRSFYVNDNPASERIRQQFVEHMKRMFLMVGQAPDQAAQNAQYVMTVETEMAKASMDRMSRRDPKSRDHKMTVSEIEAIAPNFYLDRYFKAIRAPKFNEVNVSNPAFFKTLNPILESTSLDAWKAYMMWHLLSSVGDLLSEDFVQELFKFTQVFTGRKELPVRWKRCVDATDTALGEGLGQLYVEETFGADGKGRMMEMVAALEAALRQDITDSPWMSDATKKAALIKLAAIHHKVGFPDQWRDYSALEVVRGDAVGNFFRSTQFEVDRIVQKIGQKVNKKEWIMTTPTVNAYYNGNYNEIVFPAGVLQPPFFDRVMDDPVNFGAIGMLIGHELTHGFDDQGRQFDEQGNLHDWWTPQDSQEFDKRAKCFVDEYSGFSVADDLKVNGKLTLGENIADNGGARISLMALHRLMAATQQDPNKKTDGYTPDQRFFLGFARAWCTNTTPQFARTWVTVNVHSPGQWRTNGVVQNMPEFQSAFGCKPKQPMVRENACRIW
jgi:putative endopeptidase